MKTLLKFRKNIYSQAGEDGIIEEILKRLSIQDGWFVEFGAWDGKYLSNTYALLKQGWKGVYIEGDKKKFEDLQKTASEFPNKLFPICAFVGLKGEFLLDSLLSKVNIPSEFEILSIDIDSYDWHVWKSVEKYSPKIVIIEINSSTPPDIKYIQPPGRTDLPFLKCGSSFIPMLELGKEKGYELVCHTGNMIFVRRDLIPKLNLPADELENPYTLFITEHLMGGSNRIAAKILYRLGLVAPGLASKIHAAYFKEPTFF